MLNIKEIEIDLERCEKVLRENDYMEIVIAIEELQDKYRSKIKDISKNENDVVWNYSKKDLENIEKYLIQYKKETILEERLKNINEKIEDLRKYIKDNKNEKNIEEIVNLIEEVKNKDMNLDEKYEEIKPCFSLLKNINRKVSICVLELISMVISE